MPDVEPDLLLIYIDWLYTGDMDVYGSDNDDDPEDVAAEAYRTVVKCYMLGDFLADRRFRNAATDEMVQVHKDLQYLPTSEDAENWLSQLPAQSKMSRLVVDYEAPYCEPDDLKLYPAPFMKLVRGSKPRRS